jgi:hypothetical protein
MIQTSFPKVQNLRFINRYAKIVGVETALVGGNVYIYRITVTLDTNKALNYDMNSVKLAALSVRPVEDSAMHGMSKETLARYAMQLPGAQSAHIDTVGMAYTPPTTPGGAQTQEQQAAVAAGTAPGGFGGDFPMQVAQSPSIGRNENILSAIMNFEKILVKSVKSQLIDRSAYLIDIERKNIAGCMNTKVRENYMASTMQSEVIKKLSRSIFGPQHGTSNQRFYTGEVQFKLAPAKRFASRKTQRAPAAPSMTTVVQNSPAIQVPPSKSSVSQLGTAMQGYVRADDGKVRSENSNTTLNNNSVGYNKGIAQFSRDVGALPTGKTAFNPGPKAASLNAIFKHAISPAMLIPVNVSDTVVSPMQNYQGTSQLKNNGF